MVKLQSIKATSVIGYVLVTQLCLVHLKSFIILYLEQFAAHFNAKYYFLQYIAYCKIQAQAMYKLSTDNIFYPKY
jgi:hypothetical protein